MKLLPLREWLNLVWLMRLFRIPILPWRRNVHCKFDPTIKIDCVKEILALARAGKAGNGEIAKAIEHACCFGGCAASLYLTTVVEPNVDPTPPLFSGVSPYAADCSVDELCDSIEERVNELSMKGGDLSAIDWGSVFTLVTALWQLIQTWRNS